MSHSFIKCEAVKTAYRQNKSGIVVSFLLHPSEFSSELAIAPIGTRVLLAVAEITDEIEAGNDPATSSNGKTNAVASDDTSAEREAESGNAGSNPDAGTKVTCTCVSCGSCGGSGNVWFDFRGNYLGNHRFDDLDTIERCEECENGVVEVCDRCRQLIEEDMLND